MQAICQFERQFADLLPETYHLLRQSHLVVHPVVKKVRVLGSRGLAGGARPDSDVDLSLEIDLTRLSPNEPARANLLRDALELTIQAWRGPVGLDVAAVFDTQGCGLACFEAREYTEDVCACGGVDCFGLYKIQQGFDGYVTSGIEVKQAIPFLLIWQRDPIG